MLITCLPTLIYFITSGKSSGLAKSAYASSITNQHFSGSEPFNANRIGLAGAVALMSEEGQAECKKYGDKMIADREMLNEELQN